MSVAESSWIHHWSPSFHHDYHPGIFPDSISELKYPKSSPHYETENKMGNLLPYLFALSMVPSSYFQETSESQGERTGPFTTVYQWKTLDFEFPSEEERIAALSEERFIEQNNLPLGIEMWKDRIFVTMPKWKAGVPATLAWLPRKQEELSPKMKPYPSWSWHNADSCSGLTSVFRMQIDHCGRLWVLDSGQIDVTTTPKQICPPQIVIFDLKTDKLFRRHVLPNEFIKQDSLFTNIIVDIRDDDCENVHAYVTDVWRFGLVVYSLAKDKSWRVTHSYFSPDPLAAQYRLHGLEFSWMDGVFGLALSPYDKHLQDRILYFHPMSSFREFFVKTSLICNETAWMDNPKEFKILGQSRGPHGHASASAMDRNGVLFFNLVSRDSVGCWDSRKTYKRENIGVVARSNTTMVFPNDLRLDKEDRQGLWVITNRLPFYLYSNLDENDYNFRIMHAYVDEAVKGTICDPTISRVDSYEEYRNGIDCY